MTNFKHLTQNQIFAYANESLSEPESNEIGRHLIQCPVCRQSLPVPSIEQFRAAIMTERETGGNPLAEKSDYSILSTLSFFPAFFTQPGNLVLSGGALIVLLSLSTLIWFGTGNSEKEISQSFVIDNPQLIVNQDAPFTAPDSAGDNRFSTPSVNQNAAVSASKPKSVSPKRNSIATAPQSSKQPSEKKSPADKNVSSTRGASPKCGDGLSFESRAVTDGRQIILSWEKVSNATKYHLYISDEDEILVDEFETAEATSYVLEKPLDAGKIYQWKIIVTLENGKTVVGDSQKFTVKDLWSKQKKTGNRKTSAVRCSVNSLVEN